MSMLDLSDRKPQRTKLRKAISKLVKAEVRHSWKGVESPSDGELSDEQLADIWRNARGSSVTPEWRRNIYSAIIAADRAARPELVDAIERELKEARQYLTRVIRELLP